MKEEDIFEEAQPQPIPCPEFKAAGTLTADPETIRELLNVRHPPIGSKIAGVALGPEPGMSSNLSRLY